MTTITLNPFSSRFQDYRNYQKTLKFLLQPLNRDLKFTDIKAFPGIPFAELQLEHMKINPLQGKGVGLSLKY